MSSRLFVYGTLMPGCSRWPALNKYVIGPPRPDRIGGVLLDTGSGYPGLVSPGAGGLVPGWLVTLEITALYTALRNLDAIEGTDRGVYRRITITTLAGQTCWTYEFLHREPTMTRITSGWPGAPGTYRKPTESATSLRVHEPSSNGRTRRVALRGPRG